MPCSHSSQVRNGGEWCLVWKWCGRSCFGDFIAGLWVSSREIEQLLWLRKEKTPLTGQNKYICLQTKIRKLICCIRTWFQCDSRGRWSNMNHNPCYVKQPTSVQKMINMCWKARRCPNEDFIHLFSNDKSPIWTKMTRSSHYLSISTAKCSTEFASSCYWSSWTQESSVKNVHVEIVRFTL